MKKTYKIPVTWEMYDELEIEADSLEEAIEKSHDAALTHGEYVDGSFQVDEVSLRYDYPEEYREEKIDKLLD